MDKMSETGTGRLEARVPNEVLAVLKHAAFLEGRTLTDFVVAAAREAAMRTIEQIQMLRLSMADQRIFAEALLNPPEPNAAMRRAVQRHAQSFGE